MIRRAQGSTRPVKLTITTGDTPLDLTSATVKMYMRPILYDNCISDQIIVNGASVTVENQTTDPGKITWEPTADDFSAVGAYALQPWITFPDGTEDGPEPIRVEVFDSLVPES